MKIKLLNVLTAVTLLLTPTIYYAQAPPLGTAANFEIFSSVGAIVNTGISHLTGNVGTNSGSISGFGNVDGQMHSTDGATGQASADLLIAYNFLNSTIPTFFPSPLLGNGATLPPGVYSINAATTLNLNLTLDGQGNSNSTFIFQIQAPFSANANSKVKLINGALACNVFWKVEGLVSLAPGTSMKGTIIANNAAINMNTNDTLEGRALSTAGAISIDGTLAYTPVGCGSPTLTGPMAVDLLSTGCYAVFSSDGAVANAGITTVTGDVGTNVGLTTGFNPLDVTGAIHPIPDGSTAAAAADLINVYNYLNLLPYDIELLYPAQFGNNLVLTPHTYKMNGGVTFTDTLYLNAMGDTNAVFVIQINGALSTSTYAKVLLINGTKARNVFWKVDGAVNINDYSIIQGSVIANNGAVQLNTGATIHGRAFTTTGSLTTTAVTVISTTPCNGGGTVGNDTIITSQPAGQTICSGGVAIFSVVAVGSGLTYQWRRGTVNLTNGGNISGATSDTLTINAVSVSDTGLDYNVVIGGGAIDTSEYASLVVNISPAITCPGNQFVMGTIPTVGTYSTTSTGNPLPTETYTFSGATIGSDNGNGSGSIFNVGTTLVTITSINECNSSICSFNLLVGPCNAAPALPVISGPAATCGMNSATYSVASVSQATSYVWTIPSTTGMALVSGQGTTSISVTISSGASLGNITCTAINSCGNSPTAILMVTKKPGVPDPIAGPTSVCGQSSATYSIPPTFSATSYQWIAPNGMSITSGQGTTQIVVGIMASFVAGPLKVNAINACGYVPGAQITITAHVPLIPGTISGPLNVCGVTNTNYSIAPVAGATGYLWTATGGATINGSNTGTSVNVTLSGNTGGTISCLAANTCGNGTARTITLSVASSQPGVITGPANVCGMLTATYSVVAVAGAVTYNWVLPAGITLTGGQGTSSIMVNIAPSSGTSTIVGLLRVSSTNACLQTSTQRTLSITRCLNSISMNGTDSEMEGNISIYPNPTKGELGIRNYELGIENVEVYNILGGLVYKSEINSQQSTINISSLNNGLYFVKLIDVDNNVVYTQRVVKD